MTRLSYILLHCFQHGFWMTTLKFLNRFSSQLNRLKGPKLFFTTTVTPPSSLDNMIFKDALNTSRLPEATCTYFGNHYVSHRFDILGSGWIKHRYDMPPLGCESHRHLPLIKAFKTDPQGRWLETLINENNILKSKKILQLSYDPNYQPIPWNKDSKSGYSWDTTKPYNQQRNALPFGADLKYPWELSRCHHLLQLAIFAKQTTENRALYIKEFKSQVSDFIATNPPGMGVNWTCNMDVGIRATNLLFAYDIFSKFDQNNLLHDSFKADFISSMIDHGTHLINHLETTLYLNSNHYLANIIGILCLSVYLNNATYLQFAKKALFKEMKSQFNTDGTNFEASTSYHRLSTEMMIIGAALLQSKNISIPKWFKERLIKAGFYSVHLTKPNGNTAQIGDNDSGHLIKLTPMGQMITNKDAEETYINLKGYNTYLKTNHSSDTPEVEPFWDENHLTHAPMIALLHGLYPKDEFVSFSQQCPLETSFIQALITKGSHDETR